MEASLFIFNLHYIRFLDISDAIEKISLESLTGYQDAWFLSSIFSSYMDKKRIYIVVIIIEKKRKIEYLIYLIESYKCTR
jgi:hypothetical protein